MESSTILLWVGIYGIVTGFRSLLPLAILSFFGWQAMLPLPARWGIFGQMWVFIVLAILAALEITADKWRGMPNRTAPVGLIFRFFMGGLGGAVLAASTLIPWWKGASVGALLALFGASLGYSLRQYFREATHAPDFYIAVGEDIVTFIGAYWVLAHLGS